MAKPGLTITAPAITTERGAKFTLSTTLAAPELPNSAGALPERLQDIARSYLGARRQSGVSLLDAARHLSEARLEAKHGEWAIFLEAIGLDESRARAQIRIHEEAQRDPVFADRIINGFLSETVARELLPLPAERREELLSREEPPTREEIRDAKRAPAPVLEAEPFWQSLDAHHPTAHFWTRERPDLLRSACGMTIQNRLPSGSTEGSHCSSCVQTTWKTAPAASPATPAPDLADILKRLDAHGYARTTTRQKGITTYHSFRDYSGRSEETGGEVELPEGELAFWLADLDGKAQRAQERQALYLDARDRFLALGWRLERDGVQFKLLDPKGAHYATSSIDNHLRTLNTFEAGAAKRAAAAAPALTIEQLDACAPANWGKLGYYWKSAQPITAAHNDGWTGTAPTIAGAIALVADREQARAAAPVPAPATRTDVQHAAETFAALGGDHDPERQPKGEYPFWDDAAIALDLVYTSVEEHNRRDAIDRGMAFLTGLVAGRRDDIMLKAWWHFTRMLLDPDVFSDLPLGEANPRRDAGLLLRQLQPLLQDVQATDLEGLSQAISDLNECQEGTEAAHWLTVGYALLDREKD